MPLVVCFVRRVQPLSRPLNSNGYKSKIGTQNGTLVNGHMDWTLWSHGAKVWTHTQISSLIHLAAHKLMIRFGLVTAFSCSFRSGITCGHCPVGQYWMSDQCETCGAVMYAWIGAVLVICTAIFSSYYLLTSIYTAKASALGCTTASCLNRSSAWQHAW